MTTIAADVKFVEASELAERRRVTRLIGISSAAFTALIAVVAAILAVVA